MFLNIFLFMKCRFQGSVSFWDWLSGFGVQWIATSFRCSVVFRCTLFVTDLCWTFVKNHLIMYLFKSFWLCYWYGLRDGGVGPSLWSRLIYLSNCWVTFYTDNDFPWLPDFSSSATTRFTFLFISEISQPVSDGLLWILVPLNFGWLLLQFNNLNVPVSAIIGSNLSFVQYFSSSHTR